MAGAGTDSIGLVEVFSIFALTLACLGIYGVIAYLVTQRYKEIGDPDVGALLAERAHHLWRQIQICVKWIRR